MNAPAKLAAYFDSTGIKKSWFAEKRMRVTRSTLSAWLAGRSVPPLHTQMQIQDATDGAVMVEDWT